MTKLRKCCQSGVIVIIVATCGCIPQFENPIPVPADLKVDSTLIGNWTGNIVSNENSYLQVLGRESGWMDFVLLGHKPTLGKEGLNVQTYEGFSTTIGKVQVLFFRERKTDGGVDQTEGEATNGDANPFGLGYYVTHERSFDLKLLSQAKLAQLIETKQLPGEVSRGGYSMKVVVKASSNELLAFLSKTNIISLTDKDSVSLKFSRATR